MQCCDNMKNIGLGGSEFDSTRTCVFPRLANTGANAQRRRTTATRTIIRIWPELGRYDSSLPRRADLFAQATVVLPRHRLFACHHRHRRNRTVCRRREPCEHCMAVDRRQQTTRFPLPERRFNLQGFIQDGPADRQSARARRPQPDGTTLWARGNHGIVAGYEDYDHGAWG